MADPTPPNEGKGGGFLVILDRVRCPSCGHEWALGVLPDQAGDEEELDCSKCGTVFLHRVFGEREAWIGGTDCEDDERRQQ